MEICFGGCFRFFVFVFRFLFRSTEGTAHYLCYMKWFCEKKTRVKRCDSRETKWMHCHWPHALLAMDMKSEKNYFPFLCDTTIGFLMWGANESSCNRFDNGDDDRPTDRTNGRTTRQFLFLTIENKNYLLFINTQMNSVVVSICASKYVRRRPPLSSLLAVVVAVAVVVMCPWTSKKNTIFRMFI